MKKQSFVKGAAIMAAASALCKVLSAVFKIPLDRFFLHEDGIAVFQSASAIYNVFLAICVTGIPIALSSLIAQSDDEEAATLYKSTLYTVTAFCVVCAAAIFIFSENIAMLLSGGGNAPASMALKISALALPFLGIISAGRGFFQGKSNMVPSALSQISESFIKAVLGTLICALFVKQGIKYGAAGAMVGVSLGAVSSAVILYIFYKKNNAAKGVFRKEAAAKVLKLSLPVTLGAFGYTAALLIDTLSVTSLLASSGVGLNERLSLFGYLSRANTIYNLPATIITAVTMSAVPLVSAAVKNGEALKESVQNSVRLIFLVAAPCAFGLMFFAKWIFLILYSSSAQFNLLEITGLMVLIIPCVQASTAMLQASNRVWSPIAATGFAIILKTVLNFILIPERGIVGAPIATVAAFLVAFIVNIILFRKELIRKDFIFTVIKILFCAFISCGAAKLIFSLKENLVMLVLAIFIAAVLYAGLSFACRLVTKEDIKR